ncbi:hypothetical protein BT93_E0373 [Corymbia citriodora subsp. variegata]|nr:hypothetical protein BT93_E0373 [Corymbia citriodora subsp. variegata]
MELDIARPLLIFTVFAIHPLVAFLLLLCSTVVSDNITEILEGFPGYSLFNFYLIPTNEHVEKEIQRDRQEKDIWNEEGKRFHKQALSLVTKMRLVQGDRCFTKWKGYVVDSVGTAFLAQKVSDKNSREQEEKGVNRRKLKRNV